MKFVRILSIAMFIAIVASCCSCRNGKSKTSLPLATTEWQLTQYEGNSINATGDSYTLILSDDNRVSGMGDCNRVMGSYTLSGTNKLSFSQMASTRMFCPNQTMEDTYNRLLETIDSYTVDGETLMLLSNGDVKMVFKKK